MTETMSQRRALTRDKLVDAAVGVFAEKGVLGASVEEICEAAGFTRGAFYSNFDSKDDLGLAVLTRQKDAALAATQAAIASLPDPSSLAGRSIDDVVVGAIGAFLSAQPKDLTGVLAGAALRLHAAREESLRPAYREFLICAHSTFGELVERAASSLGYRLVVPGRRVVEMLQGVYEQAAIRTLIDGEQADQSLRAELMAGVLKAMLVRVN